jgi:hypothetical protein
MQRFLRGFVVAVGLALILLLTSPRNAALQPAVDAMPAPVQQGAGFELGGQIMTFLYPNEMRSAGMSWLKMQVVWNRGGSTADAQNIITHARNHGFKVLLSIKGNRSELAVNQQQYYRDYATFVAAVARLGPDAIEIWNEPNIDREWPAGLIHGGVYTQLLAQAYPAIKAANPNVMVISGAPAPTGYFGGCAANGCDDKLFIEQMRDAGAAQYFDCTGMHYNEGVLPPSATSGDPRGSSDHYSRYYPAMVSTYRAVFPSKPLCFTELGYLTPEGLGSLPAGYEWGANTSRQEQADWLAQAAALSRDGGLVRLMVVWNVDASIYNSDPMAGWSIIRNGNCLACTTLANTMGVGQPTATPSGPGNPAPGLKGEYYDNIDFTNLRVTRIDPLIDFNWGQSIPATGVGADTFSVRWTGQVLPLYSETYTFYTTSDDGVRLWVNGQQLINNWTDHSPTENSGTITLAAGQRYDIRLEYYENTLGAQIQLQWASASQPKQIIPQSQLFSEAVPSTPTPTPTSGPGAGLTGQYFDNADLSNPILTRVDSVIHFDWGNAAPASGVSADTFSIRWTGRVLPRYSEIYTFHTTTDDGVRLWVNGQQIINNWNDYAPTENRGTIALQAGQAYDLRMEYYDNTGGAVARLEWSSASQFRQVIPQSQLLPLGTPTSTPTATATPTLTPTPSATIAEPTPAGSGLTGQYFDNLDFTSLSLTRIDPTVNFDWGVSGPASGMGADTFSVRWTGQVQPAYSQAYTFYTTTDDGVRLWVNGQQIINNWNDYAPTENSGTINLFAGQRYDIRLEYYENSGGAVAQLRWSSLSQPKQIIPQNRLFPLTSTPLTATATATNTATATATATATPTTTPTSTPTATLTSTITRTPTPTLTPTSTATSSPAGAGTGLTGQYFDNADLTNLRLTRLDATVNFNWGRSAPAANIGADTFSIRWTGQVEPRYSETYTFYTVSDDGVRLWVNGQQLINDWTDHAALQNSGSITLAAGQRYDIRLEYYDGSLEAVAQLLWASPSQSRQVIPQSQLYPAASATPTPQPGGLFGEYFDNKDLTLLLFARVDATVNFDWGNGAPRAGMGTETFSERWTGQVVPLYSETYTFYTLSDDGVRLWVNGQLLINNWTLHAPTENRGTIALQAGQPYAIRLEHYEDGGGALIQLFWSSARQARQVIPPSQLIPASGQSAALSVLSADLLAAAPEATSTDLLILPTATATETEAPAATVVLPQDTTMMPDGLLPTLETPVVFPPAETATATETVPGFIPATETPTATPTLLPGEVTTSTGLCESQAEGAAGVLSGEQLPIGLNAGIPWLTALRFCDVQVPAGARVISAWVELAALDPRDSSLIVDVTFEDTGSSGALLNGSPLSLRQTLLPVAWELKPWFAGARYRTPELAGIAGTVFSRPDWVAGHAVTVLFRGHSGEVTRLIAARPYEAQLVVSYVVDTPVVEPVMPTDTPTEMFVPTSTETPVETPEAIITETPSEEPLPTLSATPMPDVTQPESTAEATEAISG